MIGRLRGTLVHRAAGGEVVIDVAGVGYRIVVSPATAVALGPVGDDVVVHTHLRVREDALSVFGFATAEARDCFESLLGAHGVGPGLALAILAVHGPGELRQLVFDGDAEALTLVPGVGPKTAARLLLELTSRLHVADGAGFDATTHTGAAIGVTHTGVFNRTANAAGGSLRAEVRAALAGLGYQPDEVRLALGDLPADGDVPSLVRSALQTLGAPR